MQYDTFTSTAFYQVKGARWERIYVVCFYLHKIFRNGKNADTINISVIVWGPCWGEEAYINRHKGTLGVMQVF